MSGPPDERLEHERISDEAVLARTGKTWSEWLELLDAAGAAEQRHAEIAATLRERHGLSGWWAQTVTVGFEQARGLRQKHEKASGFEISVTRTLPAPVERVWAAWTDEGRRRAWLEEPVELRALRPPGAPRLTWEDGRSVVAVSLTMAGPGKTRVSVQHGKLADASAARQAKALWAERLAGLKELLGR